MPSMTTSHAAGRVPEITKGDRYRRARLNTGIGSAEFADRIGVSRNTVSAIESDRTAVRKIVANAWALATGVPVEWLETGVLLPHLDSNQKPADYQTRGLVKRLLGLPPRNRPRGTVSDGGGRHLTLVQGAAS